MMTQKSLQVELMVDNSKTAMEYEHFLRMLGLVPIIKVKQEDIVLRGNKITNFSDFGRGIREDFQEMMDITTTELTEFKEMLKGKFEENMAVFDKLLKIPQRGNSQTIKKVSSFESLKKILQERFDFKEDSVNDLVRIFQEADLCTIFNIVEMRYACYCFGEKARCGGAPRKLSISKNSYIKKLKEELIDVVRKLKDIFEKDSNNFIQYAVVFCMVQENIVTGLIGYDFPFWGEKSKKKYVNANIIEMPTYTIITEYWYWRDFRFYCFGVGEARLHEKYSESTYFWQKAALEDYTGPKSIQIYREMGNDVALYFLYICLRTHLEESIEEDIKKLLKAIEMGKYGESHYIIYIAIEILTYIGRRDVARKIYNNLDINKVKEDYIFLFGEENFRVFFDLVCCLS